MTLKREAEINFILYTFGKVWQKFNVIYL